MNLELVDSRDAGADDGGSLAAFETRIGDGIKRAHRSIPDDALVPAYLHPRPVRVEVVDVAVGSGAVTKSTILSAAPGGRESLFIDHRDPKKGHDPRGGGKEHATPTFRWISPTHRQVSVAVHNSLFDSGAAAQDAPQTTTTFSFAGAKLVRFFGAGNRGASMEIPKDNRDVRLKNLDINHYSLDSHTSLYGVVPLVYCTMRVPSRSNRKSKRTGADDHPANNNNNNKQGRPSSSSQMDSSDETVTVGILFLCGATMRLRASDNGGEGGAPSLSFTADGGGVRIFFLEGPTPTAVLKQYHQLTGPQAFVPLWALGYHQCRWSYRDQSDVLDTVHQGFLDHKLPADAIWLDIDHTDDKRYLTWDKSKFPNPIRMQRRLFEEGGRRLVTISDPHIKRDPGYFVFAQGEQGGHFVTNGLGSKAPFFGHCWPGQSAWIDFQQEATRRWYATLYRYDVYRGSAPQSGIWNDMNEFSVFSGPDLTLPLTESAHIGGTVYERDVHNTNGFYQTMATWQGLYDRDLQHLLGTQKSPINNGARRPFVLTRSFFAGSHRYASVWTGDNQGKWDP